MLYQLSYRLSPPPEIRGGRRGVKRGASITSAPRALDAGGARPHFLRMTRFLATLLALTATSAAAELAFSPAQIAGWEPHAFKGETAYALAEDGQAVRAACDASASGLFLRRTIDLTATPILEWRWRVDETFPPGPAETTKRGDDYPARLYVVKEALLPWNTMALNYVWASSQAKGAEWPNAYAAQARMVALRSGPGDGWVTERRDLRADFRRVFGEDVTSIDAVAIMTDCDDRKTTAEALYGDLRFLPAD